MDLNNKLLMKLKSSPLQCTLQSFGEFLGNIHSYHLRDHSLSIKSTPQTFTYTHAAFYI